MNIIIGLQTIIYPFIGILKIIKPILFSPVILFLVLYSIGKNDTNKLSEFIDKYIL